MRAPRASTYCFDGGVVVSGVDDPEAGGVVEFDWSDAGGGVVVLSGGVVLAGGGGVEDIDELSPLGEVDGEVDCCFEQAAKASNALRHTNIMLRFIEITSLVGRPIRTHGTQGVFRRR